MGSLNCEAEVVIRLTPEDRDGLRGREREIPPGSSLAAIPVALDLTQGGAVLGAEAEHQGPELVLLDAAREPEGRRSTTKPAAERFPSLEVVVLPSEVGVVPLLAAAHLREAEHGSYPWR